MKDLYAAATAAGAGCEASNADSMSLQDLVAVSFPATRGVHELEERHWSEGCLVTLRARPQADDGGESIESGEGLRGSSMGVAPDGSGRLLIRLDDNHGEGTGQTVFCRLDELSFPSASTTADAGVATAAAGSVDGGGAIANAAVEAVRALFVPGSVFEGTIAIPGMVRHGAVTQEEERQPYTLQILSESDDEVGRSSLLVRHAAYGDEQVCHLNFSNASSDSVTPISSPEVRINYADGETLCDGVVELGPGEAGCTVRGRVMQLVQGEEGFYEPSTEVTHTFKLFRVTACAAQAKHAALLEVMRGRRARELSLWIRSTHNGRETPMRTPNLPWNDIVLTDASRLCEVQCAELRRQGALLDRLCFQSPTEKDSVLRSLRAAGLNRASCHQANDDVMMQLKTLLQACLPVLEDSDQFPAACVKAHHRMQESYSRFDRSLRTAEVRLPVSTISSWLRPRKPEEPDTPCAVCFLSLGGAGEECVQLPCGHQFHFDCVSTWLHSHTTCPNCRAAVSELSELGSEKSHPRPR